MQKELEMTRIILLEKLRSAARKEGVTFDAAFLKHLIDLLERSYKISIQYEVDADSFMVLIALIIEKLKKEKLIVYDPKGRTFVSVKKMQPKIREESIFSEPIEEEFTRGKHERKTRKSRNNNKKTASKGVKRGKKEKK